MRQFTVRDTNICKGIAILFMILHHSVGLYYNRFDLSWYAENSTSIYYTLLLFFSTAGKVCVPLFTVLSGYGLAISYSKIDKNKGLRFDISFILQRYLKLYSIYLPIAVIVSIIVIANSFLSKPGTEIISMIKYCLFDLNMFYRLFMKGRYTWYLDAIIILYLIFPVLYRLIKKNKVLVIVLTAIPWIDRLGFNLIGLKWDSVWTCLLPFAIGIWFQQDDVLSKMDLGRTNAKNVILPSMCIIVMFILRLIFSVQMDIFFAVSIIFFEINVISFSKYTSKALCFIGMHSSNMWLLHSTILSVISSCIIDLNPLLKFIVATLITLSISFIVEKVKVLIGYNQVFAWVRSHIDGHLKEGT